MRYVIFDIRYDLSVTNGKIDYYVSEFSAVLTDYSMKTADTFTFFNEADRLKARAERIRYGEKKVVVDTIAEGYRVFREWFPEDACMMIWKHSVIHVLNYCGRKAHIRKVKNVVELQGLYRDMAYLLRQNEVLPLDECLMEQGLKCSSEQMGSSRYRVKAMLRLFRKLHQTGIGIYGNPFSECVYEHRNKELRAYNFFPELVKRHEKQKNLELMQKIEKFGLKCSVNGSLVKIYTQYADYKFDLLPDRAEGHYNAHRFYKGSRVFQVEFGGKKSLDHNIKAVVRQIRKIEIQAEYGVGNDEIAALLERIMTRFGSDCHACE